MLCDNCHTKAYKKLFSSIDYLSQDEFDIVECVQCGLCQTSPKPVDISRYYPQIYYGNKGNRFIQLVENLIIRSRNKKVSLVLPHSKVGTVLDIGCGRGVFLQKMAQLGWKSFGTETEDTLISNASDIHNVTIVKDDDLSNSIINNQRFDAITMFHVLEHTNSPNTMIKKIHTLLKPSGIFILEVPNFSSFQAGFTKDNWFHLDVPRHLYHFKKKTLINILQQNGFSIYSVQTHSFEYGYFGLLQSLQNLLTRQNNHFYSLLKKEHSKTNFINYLIIGITGLIFTLPTVLMEMIASFTGYGSVLRIIAKKS